MSSRGLYVIACGATPASEAGKLVRLAQADGWDVCVLTSPAGRRFADIPGLEKATGHPVRSEYKNPGDPDILPPPDAIIVAPATVNTINKWAAGICDTLALGILVEAIGKRLPIVAIPFTNNAHAAHPAFAENIAKLRSWGVTVLFRPGGTSAARSRDRRHLPAPFPLGRGSRRHQPPGDRPRHAPPVTPSTRLRSPAGNLSGVSCHASTGQGLTALRADIRVFICASRLLTHKVTTDSGAPR